MNGGFMAQVSSLLMVVAVFAGSGSAAGRQVRTDARMSVFGAQQAPVESLIRPALCSMAGGGKVLSGKSAVVVGDRYVMTVHLPQGYRLKTAEGGGEKAETENMLHTVAVRIIPSATETVNWTIRFAR